jgi:hypothetical protein
MKKLILTLSLIISSHAHAGLQDGVDMVKIGIACAKRCEFSKSCHDHCVTELLARWAEHREWQATADCVGMRDMVGPFDPAPDAITRLREYAGYGAVYAYACTQDSYRLQRCVNQTLGK